MTKRYCLRSLVASLLVLAPSMLTAAPPDLTAAGVIAALKTDPDSTPVYGETYNLGPTGLRGWIYILPTSAGGDGAEGTITTESRQILVTVASTPASAVLAVDDVILGAMAGSSGTVPSFTNDCRKAFGMAIGDAEKTGAGTLRVKRWRAGVTTDVNIPMTVMGNYTDTAPYSCPKSALILANARTHLVGKLLANPNYLTSDWAGAIHGLALLAGVAPGDANYATVQTRLQAYARALAATTPNPSVGLYMWDWSYIGLFLSEYYLVTGDANVVTGLNNYTVALANVQSRYGTYNHTGSLLNADGSLHGTCPPYGPVNQIGIIANMAIVMGKKALVAAGQALDPEINPAIYRGTTFFAWFVNKGGIPYGEHEPNYNNHGSNGKDASTAVLFGLQAGRTVETEFFSRMAVAGFNGREYGHCGQGFSYLWGAMGANMGGSLASAEYLKQVRWHLDLERRTDGSFVYDGQEQYGGGSTANGTYQGESTYEGLNPTAVYILTYSLPLQRLYITGKSANPTNTLDSTKVLHAIASATFKQDSPGFTTTQLIAFLNDFDPVVRNIAASELAKRTLTPTEIDTLIAMLASTDANSRQGACQTLGILQNATALPLITQRLNDSDVWVRAKAASAIRNYTSATASAQLTPMLTAFIANATDPEVIDWIDPVQISNRYLSLALFGNAIPDGSAGNNVAAYTKDAPKNLLYPAVRAGLKQPDSYPRSGAAMFVYNRLSLADVQELALDIFDVITKKCQADPMWNYEPQLTGIKILQKFNCAEGLPMALSMLNVQEGWGWDSTTYLPPCMTALKTYGDLARWTRPTINNDISIMRDTFADSDYTTVYPQMIDTISSISSAITSPVGLINLLPLATPQVVATTSPKAITLAGTSPRSSVTFTNVTSPAHGALTGTAPNLTYTPAAGYTGPDSFTFQVVDSLTTSDPGTVSIIVGTAGTGLKGKYFDNMDFTAPVFSRTDPQINFDWGTGSPSNSIASDTFSVRWSGLLLVPETGTYTFSTLNSDGVRLYLNGVQVIDDFMDQATHWKDSASISLTSGQMVELQMEYYENTGSAVAKLKWTGPSFAGVNGSIIAKEWLFDGTGATNHTPYAHAQRVTLVQNTAQTIMLQGSGGTLTYSVITQPAHGTLTGTAPSLTYTPTANYTGSDSFTFRVNDGTTNSAPATVSIGIWAGQPVSYTWLSAVPGNWSTAGNWTSSAAPAATGQPYYSLDFTPDGTYTATHDLNNGFQLNQLNMASAVTLAGTMSLDFTANGALLPQFNQSSTNAVIINAPVILSAITTFGGSGVGSTTMKKQISGTGGLIKDNAGPLQISNVNNTYSGGTIINSGIVSLGFQANAALGTGTVTLNGSAIQLSNNTVANPLIVNGGTIYSQDGGSSTWSGPVTLNGSATIDCWWSMAFSGDISGAGGLVKTDLAPLNLSGNNSYTGPNMIKAGKLSCSKAGALGSGGLIISIGATVALNYTGTREVAWLSLSGTPMPNGTYGSTASSAANKNDTYFSGTGTVTVNNSVPVASPQSVSTPEDIAKAITLTAIDADGKPMTYIIVTQAAHGSLSGTAPTVTYTSAANYNGDDSFTFKVNDGLTNSETATVSITVTAVNDAPAATPQSVTTAENTALPITLAGTDVEASPLTYAIVEQPAHGSLSGTPPNVTYTPTLNYGGSDSFTFKVNDGAIDSMPAMVSITVTDTTPPTLARSNIVDNKAGGPIPANTQVSYTVTFNEDMNASTVSAADFGNAGTSDVTFGTVTETAPGVFSVQATPTSAGTLILKVNAGADLKNVSGLALNTASAILDDTTITVNPPPPPANRWWDGGTVNIGTDGNGASAGGSGTWDTTLLNWDAGTSPHVAWNNFYNDIANFAGTAGTVTLGTDINLSALNITNGTGWVLTNNKLIFASGGSIQLNNGANSAITATISSGITGSPTVTNAAGEALTFDALTGLPQTLGAIALSPRVGGTADNSITLQGATTGNSAGDITLTTTDNGQRSTLSKKGSSTWTVGSLNGAYNARLILSLYDTGRLIVTGGINRVGCNMESVNATLELRQAGNLFTATGSGTTTPFNAITKLQGKIDNASSGLITFSGNPAITFSGNFTLAGNSLDFGTGTVALGASRTVTVENAASTMTLGGIISGTAGLTKTGDGALVLSGANTGLVGGNAYINAGTLRLQTSANALGGASGPTIQLGDTNGTATATLQLNTALTLTNNITVRAGSSGLKTITMSAAVVGGFSGTITANDDVTILQSSGSTITLSGTGNTIASGKTVTFTNATTANLYDSVIWSGLGKIAYGGSSGTIAVDGQKTYTGGATLNAMSGSGSIAVIASSIPTSGTVISGPFGTGTLTINSTKLRSSSNGDFTVGNAIIIGGDPTFPANSNEKNVILTGNAILGAATRTFYCGVGSTVAGKYVEFAGIISGSGSAGIIKSGTGLLKFSNANTYPGNTTISAGKLALSGSGSLDATPSISIAAGATFDVSAITPATYTIKGSSPVQTLACGSATGTAIINATGKALTLNSGALASFQAVGGVSTSVGKITVSNNLTLNANAVTVNVTGGALAVGTYRLLDCTGTLANTGTFGTPTITGTTLASGYTASISVTTGSSGHVDLVVKATPSFSGLTTPSITYGTASVSLGGTVCSTNGPTTIYAANGDAVTATINGHAVSGTVSGSSGAFTITYNDASLATNGVGSYTIAYAYAGNSGIYLNAANTNTSTSLTVNQATLTITAKADSKTYGQTKTYGSGVAAGSYVTITGLQNSDAIDTVTITDTDSGGATTAAAGGTYNLTPSAAHFSVGSSANYNTITYTTGLLSVAKAPLTVTPDNKTRTVGAANPAFTCTITGYQNGEDYGTAAVTGTPNLSTDANNFSPQGTYTITCDITPLSAANYTFSAVNGILTVVSKGTVILFRF